VIAEGWTTAGLPVDVEDASGNSYQSLRARAVQDR
jgi:hypothetical protein